MMTLLLLPLFIVGALAQRDDCRDVKCEEMPPCNNGVVMKFGCCSICVPNAVPPQPGVSANLNCDDVICAEPEHCDGGTIQYSGCCKVCVMPKGRPQPDVTVNVNINCAMVLCESAGPCEDGHVDTTGCCPICVTHAAGSQPQSGDSDALNCANKLCASPYPCIGVIQKKDCCDVCVGRSNPEIQPRPVRPINCAAVRCASPGPCENGFIQKIGCCSRCLNYSGPAILPRPIDCSAVFCANPGMCDDGYILKRDGCCSTCVKATDPVERATIGPIDCTMVKCVIPRFCEEGYILKKKGCCFICVKNTVPVIQPFTSSPSPINCNLVLCKNPRPCNGVIEKRGCCEVCVERRPTRDLSCPPGICSRVKCGVREEDCIGFGQYIKKKGGFCGCCDACITVVGEGQDCSTRDTECNAGTFCNESTKQCERNSSCPIDVCKYSKCGVRQGECQGENEYIKEGAGMCGCCNACVTVVDVGGDCSNKYLECRAGTKCNSTTKTCELI